MPRGRHLVKETRAGFTPIDNIERPIKPPPKPLNAERSVVPPAFWRDRQDKKQED
jgi:hypothetical protein